MNTQQKWLAGGAITAVVGAASYGIYRLLFPESQGGQDDKRIAGPGTPVVDREDTAEQQPPTPTPPQPPPAPVKPPTPVDPFPQIPGRPPRLSVSVGLGAIDDECMAKLEPTQLEGRWASRGDRKAPLVLRQDGTCTLGGVDGSWALWRAGNGRHVVQARAGDDQATLGLDWALGTPAYLTDTATGERYSRTPAWADRSTLGASSSTYSMPIAGPEYPVQLPGSPTPFDITVRDVPAAKIWAPQGYTLLPIAPSNTSSGKVLVNTAYDAVRARFDQAGQWIWRYLLNAPVPLCQQLVLSTDQIAQAGWAGDPNLPFWQWTQQVQAELAKFAKPRDYVSTWAHNGFAVFAWYTMFCTSSVDVVLNPTQQAPWVEGWQLLAVDPSGLRWMRANASLPLGDPRQQAFLVSLPYGYGSTMETWKFYEPSWALRQRAAARPPRLPGGLPVIHVPQVEHAPRVVDRQGARVSSPVVVPGAGVGAPGRGARHACVLRPDASAPVLRLDPFASIVHRDSLLDETLARRHATSMAKNAAIAIGTRVRRASGDTGTIVGRDAGERVRPHACPSCTCPMVLRHPETVGWWHVQLDDEYTIAGALVRPIVLEPELRLEPMQA
jgi:hypothetical protein